MLRSQVVVVLVRACGYLDAHWAGKTLLLVLLLKGVVGRLVLVVWPRTELMLSRLILKYLGQFLRVQLLQFLAGEGLVRLVLVLGEQHQRVVVCKVHLKHPASRACTRAVHPNVLSILMLLLELLWPDGPPGLEILKRPAGGSDGARAHKRRQTLRLPSGCWLIAGESAGLFGRLAWRRVAETSRHFAENLTSPLATTTTTTTIPPLVSAHLAAR